MDSKKYVSTILFSLMFSPLVLAGQSDDKPAVMVQDLSLTKAQIDAAEGEALDGSVSAAKTLFNYYMNVRLDFESGLKWIIIGSENGDANSQYMAYYMLHGRTSESDKRRAMFWLKKSAQSGYESAVDELRRIEGKGSGSK